MSIDNRLDKFHLKDCIATGCLGSLCGGDCPCSCHKEKWKPITMFRAKKYEPESPQEKCTCEGSFVHPCDYCVCPVKVQTADDTRIGKDYYTRDEVNEKISKVLEVCKRRGNLAAECDEIIYVDKSEEKEWRKALLDLLADGFSGKHKKWMKVFTEDLRSRFL